MPVPRQGIVQRGPDEVNATVIPDDGSSDGWLAVATGRSGRPAPEVSVAASSCQFDRATAETLGLHVMERPVPSVDHPLDVTDAAYRFGADALLQCASGSTTVAVPSLFRRILSTPTATRIGPPSLGARPVSIETRRAEVRTLAAAAAAHLAAGDASMADFALERALRHGARGSKYRLSLGGMEVAAAAGRPEAAYRRGRRVSRNNWNRDNNPHYLLGRAAAEAAIGKTRDAYATREEADQAAERLSHRRLASWLDWAGQLRGAMAGDTSTADLRAVADRLSGENAARWSAATRLIATRQDVPLEPLALDTPLEQKLELDALADSLEGTNVPASCPDDESCPLDVYGRRLAAAAGSSEPRALADRTLRMGRAVFQPGVAATVDATPSDQTRRLPLFAVLATHLDGPAAKPWVESFDTTLSGLAVRAVRACDSRGSVAGSLEAYGPYLALETRLSDHSPARLRFLDWLVNGDGRNLCDDPAGAARSLVTLAGDASGMRPFLTPLFPALVDRAEVPEDRRTIVAHAADFAAEHGPAGSCKRWRLSLAAASARAGDYRDAEDQLESAVNCGADDRYERTESILIAFVAFMRSGRLPRRTEEGVRSALERLVRHRVDEACTGLAPFEYDLGTALPDELVDLAASLEPSSPAGDEDAMLTVRSTGDDLESGRSTLDRAKSALREGDFRTAADKLAVARDYFSRLGHAPGLAQTEFLQQQFFPDLDRSARERTTTDGSETPDQHAGPAETSADPVPVADSCELAPDALPASPETRRCLIAEHGPNELADTWSDRAAEATDDGRALLAALFMLEGRFETVRQLHAVRPLSLCRTSP